MIAKMVAMTATMEATTMPAIRPSLMELSVLDGPDGMGGGDAGEGGDGGGGGVGGAEGLVILQLWSTGFLE
jgi:hypothetical protein